MLTLKPPELSGASLFRGVDLVNCHRCSRQALQDHVRDPEKAAEHVDGPNVGIIEVEPL